VARKAPEAVRAAKAQAAVRVPVREAKVPAGARVPVGMVGKGKAMARNTEKADSTDAAR
jgi:hypothetical protein